MMDTFGSRAATDSKFPGRGELICLGGILVAALVVRLAWVAIVSVSPVSDSHAYYSFAANIAEGHGYCWVPGSPTTYWAVGPSAFYALFLLIFSGSVAVAVVVANLITAMAGVFFAWLVCRSYFGARAAMFTALLYAAWPTSIMFTTVYNSEMLFCPLMLASIWAVTSERLGRFGWPTAGLIMALTAYVRPVALLFPFVLGASRLVAVRKVVPTVGGVAVALLVMLLCIAPWTARNHHVTSEVVLISTNGGTNLWMGNNPDSTGWYQQLPERVSSMSEVERNKVLGSEANRYIIDEPLSFVTRTIKKFFQLHRSETIGVAWNLEGMRGTVLAPLETEMKIIGSLFWWGTIAGGLAGIAFLLVTGGLVKTVCHPVVLMSAYLIAVQSVVVAQDRYHLQWSPLFIVLSGYAASALFKYLNSRGSDAISSAR